MFASKLARPRMRAAAASAGKPASPRPRMPVRPCDGRAAEQAHLLRRIPSPLPAAVQAKLVVGAVNDPLEHEADRMADRVMRMSAPAAGGEALQCKCAACAEEPGETLRAKLHDAHESSNAGAPAIVADVLRSAGGPVDASARAFFEPRFGRDFSQVRIHTDDSAARSAKSIGARAYTVGRHIAFAQGQYAPGSDRGRHLLAHELAHTIQQGASCGQRRPGATEQGITGLVESPEEASRSQGTEAGWAEQVIRRSVTWAGATVHETLNVAEIAFGAQNAPVTWEMLNGTMLKTTSAQDSAIKVPTITTLPLASTNPAATWMAKVGIVPAQEGGADETVLGPGPWTKEVTKAQAGAKTGATACTGTGKSTFTVRGSPSDDAVYKANRRHEDRHVAITKAAFEDAIGKWDKRLEDAKTDGTEFTASSKDGAVAKLWAAMGNTPQNAARSYSAKVTTGGDAFHDTPAGKPMSLSNPVANKDCSTSGADVTNPG